MLGLIAPPWHTQRALRAPPAQQPSQFVALKEAHEWLGCQRGVDRDRGRLSPMCGVDRLRLLRHRGQPAGHILAMTTPPLGWSFAVRWLRKGRSQIRPT